MGSFGARKGALLAEGIINFRHTGVLYHLHSVCLIFPTRQLMMGRWDSGEI